MSYRFVDAAAMTAGEGPHPAASPYDKRVSEGLGLSAFEMYRVELPAGASTTAHDHLDDQVEDVYAVVRGNAWVSVDGEDIAIGPGQFVAVTVESRRSVTAGEDGCDFIAVCGRPR